MKQYNIESILWEDHHHAYRASLPDDPDSFVTPTLTIGVVLKETKKVVILAYDIERYEDRDDVSFMLIFKSTILARKAYGTIELKKPRKGVG